VAKVSEPVSVTQSQGPQLGPDTEVSASADPIDYSVAADDTIHVAAAETLGHYADWLGTSAARLRKVNSLRSRTPVIIGRRIKLEFRTVPKDIFEQRRHEYHERLEAAYFGTHRINGTQVYVARRGDSLWSITGRNIKLPIWLLQQYNPDLDFSSLRPGTQIALPKIEDVTSL
jgi:membrane-bound lytic murein transglycosylase D